MIRIINFTDINGSQKQIRAIKCPKISNLEILLPLKYRLLYSGFEGWFANLQSPDLDEDSIIRCNNRIIVVNLDPHPIDYVWMANKTREEVIELYKHIISNCSIIVIYLNEDKSLSEVEVSYEVNRDKDEDTIYDYPHLEQVHLINEEDKFTISITSEKY